ncbi:MAG TPA: hypothetical protein VLQ93_23675 [Myxococcaceae bacterium]|nr:hypothetical protein [Myxococcaceae bacterium]
MRSLDIEDGTIASILVADDLAPPDADSLDIIVRLQDGRRFGLTLLTLEHLRRQLGAAPSVLLPSVLLVRHFSDENLLDAVRSAVHLGLERFGVLQPPIEQ